MCWELRGNLSDHVLSIALLSKGMIRTTQVGSLELPVLSFIRHLGTSHSEDTTGFDPNVIADELWYDVSTSMALPDKLPPAPPPGFRGGGAQAFGKIRTPGLKCAFIYSFIHLSLFPFFLIRHRSSF